MDGNWATAVGVLSVVLGCGCAGRAAQGLPGNAGGFGGNGVVAEVTVGGFAGAASLPDLPASGDGGPIPHCAATGREACTFTAVERADLPLEQRWGTLEGADEFEVACPPTACGDALFEVDHAGCVTVAPDTIESEYSQCVLDYLEQFSWPCAADQRVRFYRSCTIR